jgi:hypothetical protein
MFFMIAQSSVLMAAQTHATACSPERLNELRMLAQSLDSRTPKIAIELSSCPEYHDEALLWASFYQKQMGAYENVAEPAGLIDRPSVTSSRFQILGAASQGSYQLLEAKVSEGAPGFAGDAESHLILARALIKDHRYADGRANYDRYLALKPDDTDVRIEAAYSYLWEDQWRKADSSLALISTLPLTPAQKAAVARGREMAKQIHERAGDDGEFKNMPYVPFSFERVWSSFKGFSRQSLLSGYHAPSYAIDVGIMSLNSDDPATAQAAVEVIAAKNFNLSKTSDLFAKVGWWQGVESNYTAGLVYAKTLANGMRPLAGFETEPLAKYAPIPKDNSGWSRSSLFAGLQYKDRFEYRFYATSTTAQGNSGKHSLLISIPIFKSFSEGTFHVRLLAEALSAQQYSAYIYSPRESNVLLPGLRYDTRIDDNSTLQLGIDYGFVGERLNPGAAGGTPSMTQNSSGTLLGFLANYKAEINDELLAQASFKFSRTSGPNDSVTYQSGELLFGVLWYFDRPSRLEESKK